MRASEQADRVRILSHLAEVFDGHQLTDSGGISFEYYDKLEETFDAIVLLSKEVEGLNPAQQYKVVRRALSVCVSENDFSEDRLRREMKRLAHEEIKRPFKKFRIITSITASNLQITCPISFRVGRTILHVGMGSIDDARMQDRHFLPSSTTAPGWPQANTMMTMSVRAPDGYAAGYWALKDLSSFLGLANLLNNRGVIRFIRGSSIEVTNQFRAGPRYYVIGPDSDRSGSSYFYEIDYISTPAKADSVDSIFVKSEQLHKFVTLLDKCFMKDEVYKCLRLYNNALSLRDQGSALVTLWSCLETALGTARSANSSLETAKRFAFFSDRPHLREVLLRKIAERRNLAAHEGSVGTEIDIVSRLRGQVDFLLMYVLENRHGFRSHAEFCSLLQQATDVEILERDARAIALATAVRREVTRADDGAVTSTATDQ